MMPLAATKFPCAEDDQLSPQYNVDVRFFGFWGNSKFISACILPCRSLGVHVFPTAGGASGNVTIPHYLPRPRQDAAEKQESIWVEC